VENKNPIPEHSPPTQKQIRGLVSIWIAIAIMAFTALVLFWDDPFQSMGNEKPVRISIVAGILGMLVAVSDMSEWKKSKLPRVGLVLNVLAIFGATILLPYI
jgi:hypothetical protein